MPTANRVYVLTYHSQNIAGQTYASNNHIAFARDLLLLQELGLEVISALEMANAMRRGLFASLPERCVVITMDDGPLFDFENTQAPPYGEQESMLNILRRQHRKVLGLHLSRARCKATAFVIASGSAREQIAISMGNRDWMTGSWWRCAQQTGYLDIGSHSWDHVHPAVAEMADHPELVEAFHRIDSHAEAERQIAQASRDVQAVTRSDAARLFAYPYGQTNAFLVREYLPRQKAVIAAFTTQPEPVTRNTGIWEIPRFVCGRDWQSEDQLRGLLQGVH